MSSKRRFDEDRSGPAKNTRRRTAQPRWTELDNHAWNTIASFLPLHTYVIVQNHLLPKVRWLDRRCFWEQWIRDQVVLWWDIEEGDGALLRSDYSSVFNLLCYPLSIHDEEMYISLSHHIIIQDSAPRVWTREITLSERPKLHSGQIRAEIRSFLQSIPASGGYIFERVELGENPVFDFTPSDFRAGDLLSGLTTGFGSAVIRHWARQWPGLGWLSPWNHASDEQLRAFVLCVGRHRPGAMVRWFGPQWREVVSIHHSPGRFVKQLGGIYNHATGGHWLIKRVDDDESHSTHLRDWHDVRDGLLEHDVTPLWPYPSDTETEEEEEEKKEEEDEKTQAYTPLA